MRSLLITSTLEVSELLFPFPQSCRLNVYPPLILLARKAGLRTVLSKRTYMVRISITTLR